MAPDADRTPEAYRSDPDPDPKVAHANRFVKRFVVVTVALTVLNAAIAFLFGSSPVAVVASFLLTLAAAWLLIHLLFDRIDDLVRDRLAEFEN